MYSKKIVLLLSFLFFYLQFYQLRALCVEDRLHYKTKTNIVHLIEVLKQNQLPDFFHPLPEKPSVFWKFDKKQDIYQWTSEQMESIDECIKIKNSSLISTESFPVSEIEEITITMKVNKGDKFQCTVGSENLYPVFGKLASDSRFHTYRINPTNSPHWKQCKKRYQLFLHPSNKRDAIAWIQSIGITYKRDAYMQKSPGIGWISFSKHESRHAIMLPVPYQLTIPLRIDRPELLRFGIAIAFPDDPVKVLIKYEQEGREFLLAQSLIQTHEKWYEREIPFMNVFSKEKMLLSFCVSSSRNTNFVFLSSPVVKYKSDSKTDNVLLYLIDALNPEHLGCYGCSSPTSPNIDRVAKEGTLFYHCFAPSPWTKTSTSSIFTSLYVRDHHVLDYGMKLDDHFITLAELLKMQGYTTISVIANSHAGEPTNLNQGFDAVYQGASARELNQYVFTWLQNHNGEPFFLYVHSIEPHYDYSPPVPYNTLFDPDYEGSINGKNFTKARTPRDIEHVKALYNGEVRCNDEQIGYLIDKLEGLNLKEKTLFIITSDHGEAFFEHGYFTHQHGLYNDQITVPLIFRLPGKVPAGTKVFMPVSTIDIYPTTAQLLNIEPPGYIEGKPLFSLIKQKSIFTLPRKIYSQDVQGINRGKQTALVFGPWKGIYFEQGNVLELYNIKNDPKERVNLANTLPYRILSWWIKREITNWLKDGKHLWPARGEEIIVDPSHYEKLKALGYVK